MLALAARAGLVASGRDHPVSISGHFGRFVTHGEIELGVRPIKEGKRLATYAVSMYQEGKQTLEALATYGSLPSGPGGGVEPERPRLPPIEEMIRPSDVVDTPQPPISHMLEGRAPEVPGWMKGKPGGEPVWEFVQRFADGEDPDPVSLVFFSDSHPPIVFEQGYFGSVTVQLSVNVRRQPAPGYLYFRKTLKDLAHGYFQEDVDMWDADGLLVASSRQLAMVVDWSE